MKALPAMKALPTLICLVLLSLPAQAQDPPLELIYTSPPGTAPLGWFQNGNDLTLPQDANGDGQQDLVMTRRNAQGHIDGVLVIDGATQEEILRMEAELEDEFADMELVGFINLGTDGIRPALFAGQGQILLTDISSGTSDVVMRFVDSSNPYLLLGVSDFDGDEFDDIATFRSDTEQIEVWGTP